MKLSINYQIILGLFFLFTGMIGRSQEANPIIEKSFKKSARKIQKKEQLKMLYRRQVINKKNGLYAIEYGLGQGNSVIMKGVVFYSIRQGVLTTYPLDLDYCPDLKQIDDFTFVIDELEACALPNPSVIKTHRYAIENNRIKELKP